MGRPKPLLEWRGVPLVRFQIDSLLDAGAHEVVVVLGHESNLVARHVSGDRVRSVVNADYRHGKTTSVLRGILSADPDATDLLLLAVDQPRPAWAVKRVIESHVERDALITSPRYQGRGGHPLVFSATSSRGAGVDHRRGAGSARGVRRSSRRSERGHVRRPHRPPRSEHAGGVRVRQGEVRGVKAGLRRENGERLDRHVAEQPERDDPHEQRPDVLVRNEDSGQALLSKGFHRPVGE